MSTADLKSISRFIPGADRADVSGFIPGYSLDLIRSRSLLVDALIELSPHLDALTVVGAHAVIERTRILEPFLVTDSTRDADVGVSPELLAEAPLLDEALSRLGLEPASEQRPGVWGLTTENGRDLHDRLTIDFLAPASLAGGGRRAARVGPHGRRSVSRTEGTELTTIDRSVMPVSKFDTDESIDAFVAGHAALICAKTFKLFDRMDERELARNPERLRSKDAGDVYRLFATSDPVDVREIFRRGESMDTIGGAVLAGREKLGQIREQLTDLTIRHYRNVIEDSVITEAVAWWLDTFEAS